MRHPLHHRLIALLLSWAMPATSVWAAAPRASRAGVRSPAVPDDESARSQPLQLQALAPYEVLARGRRAPYGVAAVGSRVFFTDEKEGALYEIVSPGVAVARLSRLRKPRGAIADGQAVLLVAEALDPVNAKGRDQEDRARGALPRGLVLRYDVASRGVVTVASGLKHPRSLAKGPDGTLYVTSEGLLGANERHEDSDCDAADGGDDDDDDDRGPGHPGTVLRWTQATGFVTVAGGFKRPAGLVAAADGTLLVAAERYRMGTLRLFGSAFRVTAAGEVTVHLADRLRRPTGLVRDGAAHLFLSGERRERRGSHPGLILKKGREEQPSLGFASGLLAPKGLALTSAGDLVAADSMAGVVVRFRAPAPPTLRLPAPGATPRDPFDLQGAAEAGAQVLVRGGREAASALAGAAGSFSVSVSLHRNQPNTLEALAIARGGDGLASAPTAGVLIHDDIAPLIAAAGDPPANAAGWNRADVTVRFTCSDGGSGVLSCPPPRSVPSEGAGQEVFGTAFDQAGNSASTRLVLSIDKTPPAVLISDPTDGHYTNATAIAVSGRVVDATDVVLTVNGVGVEVAPPDAAGARGFSAGVPLGEAATVVLRAAAEDVAGNAGEASVTVNVDRAAPTLRVASPAVGAYLPTRAPEIELEYQDDRMLDTGSLQVLINGEDRTALFARDAAAATARLEGVLELPEGRTLIAARIRDRAGNSASAEAAFVVDTEAPVVGIAAPAEESYHRASPVSLSGSVQDRDPELLVDCVAGGSTVAATVSPQAAASGQMLSANFSCAVALTEGANAVAVVARDRFIGRETRLTRTLHLDTLAPQVAIEEPMRGTVTAAHSMSVRVRVSDASSVTVLVGGQPASCDDQGSGACASGGSALFVAGGVPLGAGPSATLTAVATDAAGNATTESVTIGIDRAPPSVSITSPVAGAYVKGGVIEVAGTAADETPIVVDVHGLPAEVRRIGTDGSGRTTYSFTAQVPAADGPLSVTATALDAAGNQGTATVELKVDSAPPQITISEPGEGFVTRAEALTISGKVVDSSPASVVIDGQPVPCPGPVGTPFGCTFTTSVVLASEGSASFEVRGRDAAGNESARTVAVTVDRTEPILEIASPSAGAAVGSLPVAVQGTVSDRTEVSVTVDGQPATRTERAWLAWFGALPEGPHTFTVVAIDAAGNQTTRTVDAVVDLGPPAVSIDAPPPGFLTRESAVPATATVNDRSAITATLGGVPMTCTPLGSGSHACRGTAPLNEGDNTLLVSATDATGRTTEQSLTVTRDSIAPTLELLTPDTISRGRPGAATATASDALGVERVVLSVACVAPASCAPQSQAFTAPPYSLALAVPEGVDPGQTLAVTAEALDHAGNVAQATRSVRVIGDGAVVGQALNDATGLPLVGASARLLGPGQAVTRETTTDERGRYSLPTTDLAAVVRIEKDGLTSVERQVDVASGAGTVPVDARLTVLADEQVSDGTAALVAGAFSLTLSAGSYRLTPLSAQGLPALLPLGFSPLAALDTRGPLAGASGSVGGLPNGAFHLVRYDFDTHNWRMVAANLLPTTGAITISLPDQGAYAVVAADTLDPEVAIPAVDEPLAGIAMVAVPVTAVSTGQVEPSVIPPTGGTAVGRIVVTSPVALPSGTVVQADVTETYSLASGQEASEEKRLVDILIYRAGAAPCQENALCASLPITPSRTYGTGELLAGKVHLDILAGREGVRGSVGGSESVTLEAGAARLFVAQGALSEDTAFVLEEHALSSFLPSTTALVPLAEVVADFSGQTLSVPAELSISSPGVGASDTLVFAKVERVDGIPRYAVVALGQLVGDRIVSRPYPGLPGVVKGGRYVLYRLGAPIGFVAGIVSSSAGPVKSLVEPAPGDPGSLPFIAFSGIDGSYILASATGQRSVQARVVGTALAASASVGVSADATTVQNLLLAGAVTTATVNPPDGTLGVNTTTAIEISSSSALNPATVVPANVSLTKLGATPAENASVAFRLVLASSGKLVSVIPQSALEFSKMYRLEALGLVDQVGGVVVVPTTTFRTKDFVAPFYDPKKLLFSMPNQDGIVTVTAPGCHPEPGCFAPGTTVLIINSGNGVVLSLTAGNSGEISSELPGSINDTLFVTLRDPLGNETSFTRSQYFDPVTKQTAVGPGGGVIESSDGTGVELRIPEGALEKGASFKISLLPETEYAASFPNQVLDKLMPGTTLGSVLKIETNGDAFLKKYAKLAFPMPDFTKAPEGERPSDPKQAFYYVSRAWRVCPGGAEGCAEEDKITLFETIDEAQVEGEGANAKVATASPPFPSLVGALGGAALMIVSWEIGRLLGNVLVRRPGIISGKVQRQRWNPGAVTPDFDTVSGAQVSGKDVTGEVLTVKDGGTFATTQSDGKFVLWDMTYSGGLLNMTAKSGIQTVEATAYEATETFLQRYQKRATVNLTFPAVVPPPPPPSVEIEVLNGAGNDVGAVVVAGTDLRVVFKLANDTATEVRAFVNGDRKGIALDQTTGDALTYVLNESFSPQAAGAYTIAATVLSNFGPPLDVQRTIRVIASGGSVDNLPNEGPKVTSVSPKPSTAGVLVTVFPEVSFSEPVKRLRNRATGEENVSLYELSGATPGAKVALAFTGVSPSGQVLTDNDLGSPEAAVTSLTLQPVLGLKYGQTYRLVLTEGIEDLDKDAQGNPAPKKLERFQVEFETFGPVSVGAGVNPDGTPLLTGSPGLVVLNDHAFIAQTNFFVNGNLLSLLVTDPLQPKLVGTSDTFAPRPVDIAGELVGNAGMVAVAVGSTNLPKPASVLIFDASQDKPVMIGAASVANSAFEGYIARLQMKDGFVYTATARRGIQAVNVQSAIAAWSAAGGRFQGLQNARRDLNTDGAGFGQDAVEITVPIPNKANGLPHQLTDLRVTDIGGRTIAVVASEGGLAIAAPQQGSLLFPPGTVEHAVTDLQGQRQVKATLTWGHTLTLGRLQDRDVALVVGNGSIDGVSGRLVFMVVDLNDPQNPQGLGSLDLTDEIGNNFVAVDMLLKDQTALIGVQNRQAEVDAGFVLLVSVADMMQPAKAGRLDSTPENPIGGRLALDDNGLLYSSARMSTGGTSTHGGVKTATFNVLGAVLPPRPTLARLLPETTGQPAQEETIDAMAITSAVFPSKREVADARLEIRNGAGTTVVPPTPIALTQGRGIFDLPKGYVKNVADDLVAILSFKVAGKELVSAPRSIPIGSVALTIDSNNDTIVDDADDVAVRDDPNKDDPQRALRFAFWDGQPTADLQDALVDYATLRLRLKHRPADDERLGLLMPGSTFLVRRKVEARELTGIAPQQQDCRDEGKLHLCDFGAARRQADINDAGLDPTGTPPPRLADSSGALWELPKGSLSQGENRFLFKCVGRRDGTPACPASAIQVVKIRSNDTDKLDERRVEIRPFGRLTTVQSFRESDTISNDPGSDHYKVNSVENLLPGWEVLPEGPDSIKDVTVIVHGFNLSQDEFTRADKGWFATWAKRLYWAGHPILQAQDNAWTIGISWPGDFPGPLPFDLRKLPFYPEDEFNALQTAIPFGKYLEYLRGRPGVRKVNIFAHSLGNMVVNNALKERPPTPGEPPINYVMNQAAISSEAFQGNYEPLEPNTLAIPGVLSLVQHAQTLGYPTVRGGTGDGSWVSEESQIESDRAAYSCPVTAPFTLPPAPPSCLDNVSPPPDACSVTRCDRVTRYFSGQAAMNPELGVPLTSQAQTAFFTTRWGKLTRNEGGSMPGAWTRLFAENVDPDTRPNLRIFNTYSSDDAALRIDQGKVTNLSAIPEVLAGARTGEFRLHAWRTAQTVFKPTGTLWENLEKLVSAADATDTIDQQKWWSLAAAGRPSAWRSTSEPIVVFNQEAIWGNSHPIDGASRHRRTREWAELALWYPALAPAAGVTPLQSLSLPVYALSGVNLYDLAAQGRNIDFTKISGNLGLVAEGNESHSYLAVRRFPDVWKGFRVIRDLFKQ